MRERCASGYFPFSDSRYASRLANSCGVRFATSPSGIIDVSRLPRRSTSCLRRTVAAQLARHEPFDHVARADLEPLRLEALRDLRVGLQDRLAQLRPAVPRRDPGQ